MRAGDLRHYVQLQHSTQVLNTYGEMTLTWATTANIWAGIWPLSGQQYMEAGRLQNVVTHRLRIRWRADVKSNDRISYKGRVFEIVNVLNRNELNRDMDLMCKEIE